MYEISLTDRAMRELQHLPSEQAERLLATFEKLRHWPQHDCDVRKLAGPFKGLWRVRAGSYRALLDVDTRGKTILVTRIGPRERIYG